MLNSYQPSAEFSAKVYDENFMFNVAGISIFLDKDLRMYLLALLNSKVTSASVEILNPTMNMNAGDAAKIPVIIDDDQKNEIEKLACENVELCRSDWDSFEISWEFRKHPLI